MPGMKAILIDPATKSVETIKIEPVDDVRAIYGLLEVSNIGMVRLPNEDVLYVDGEGLLKTDPGSFFQVLDGQPLPGKGLLVGITRTGRSTRPKLSLKEARALVTFPDVTLVGFENFEGVEDWGFGPMPLIGVRAIFRPK